MPAFTLYLYEAGRLIRQYPIAVGRMVTPSSFGAYRIINRVVNPTWYPEGRDPVPPGPANPIGSRWLGINLDGYGIHGTNDPGLIGKAVSKGCIRMRNEDVEELTELVRIGTPVRLAYETIVVEPDRKGEQYTITVYPDIYRKGTNTPAELWSKLVRQGIRTTIGDEQLRRILRAAAGKPEALPLDIEVRVGGKAVSRGAFWSEGQLWLPLEAVAEAFGKKVAWEENGRKALLDGHGLERVVARSASGGGSRGENGGSGGLGGASGDGMLVAAVLDEVERILGVHSSYDQRAGSVNLLVPEIYADGEPLGIKGFWSKGMLYFPLFELADHLGAEIDWDLDLEQLRLEGSPVPATLINDLFYVPFYAVKDLPLGVDLRWEEE
ncbi:MAG: L,D-transpeptidase family protein [Firmicutes bacterium]|nr:L,D-transpeptidase family protein [Bacillota bacterium]